MEEASTVNQLDILDTLDNIPTLENESEHSDSAEQPGSSDGEADVDGLSPSMFDIGSMPTAIQQSIEALMSDVSSGTLADENPYHLKVCFKSSEVEALYANHPTAASAGCDAGWDLHCAEDVTIEPGQTVFLDFGLSVSCVMDGAMAIPLLLMPRSSISKTPLRLANSIGLIDPGYRGTIKAAIDHRGTEPYEIKRGDRLFQLVAMPTQGMGWTAVNSLDSTERGDGGFGSTGR